MAQGKIKKWLGEKNFGFIEADQGDVFFHISWCVEGFEPREWVMVNFVMGTNDRTGKTQAQDVGPAQVEDAE